MNQSVKNYYAEFSDEGPRGYFHRVIALHETTHFDWQYFAREVPFLPRGWFELSHLSKEDRIEFTKEYWFSKLLCVSSDADGVYRSLSDFFAQIDDIGIYITQQAIQAPCEAHMVYCLKNDGGFFHGYPPASLDSINYLQKQFPQFRLPNDYLAFLEIHDGFCKYIDTGLIKVRDIAKNYLKLQSRIQLDELMFILEGHIINPPSLVPFYESNGLHCYQCFYADWSDGEEMGNIYYSEDERLISDFLDRNNLVENLAFTSFLDWLVFYLKDTTDYS